METQRIARIEVDGQGRLLVFPESSNPGLFELVYRAAAEVRWDPAGYFHSPVPREWSHARWLEQILFAVRDELGVTLTATYRTEYWNIAPEEEEAMRLALSRPTLSGPR